jgi:hypothetical protein
MEKPSYTITASTSEKFLKIEEALKELPEVVLLQIENVKSGGVGYECQFRKVWGDSVKIALPKDIRQMTTFDDYVGCYSEKFFFKHEIYDLKKIKLTYYFVDLIKQD